jgi:hypothetical protein
MRMSDATDKRSNRRALAVLFMFFSFLFLPPSGVALHLTDGSHQLARHVLMTVHNTGAIICLVSMSVHVVLNRKAILRYIVSGGTGSVIPRRTAMAVALTVAGIVGLAVSHVFHFGR